MEAWEAVACMAVKPTLSEVWTLQYDSDWYKKITCD